MTVNKQKSAIKVAGALGCSEDADGRTTRCALTPWIPVPGIKPKILRGETALLSPRSLIPTLPSATSPAGKVDTCLSWGARTGGCQSHGGQPQRRSRGDAASCLSLEGWCFPKPEETYKNLFLANSARYELQHLLCLFIFAAAKGTERPLAALLVF